MLGITEAAQLGLKVLKYFTTEDFRKSAGDRAALEYKARTAIGSELLRFRGNLTEVLSEYIIEPTIFVTEDASTSDVLDQVTMLLTDIFGAFYSQVFELLTNEDIHGISGSTALRLLSTNRPSVGIKKSLVNGLKSEVLKGITRESSAYHFDKETHDKVSFLDTEISLLTHESVISPTGTMNGSVAAKAMKFDTTLASSILQRTIQVTLTRKRASDGELIKVTIPIIIRASIEKIKNSSIISELTKERRENDIEMSILDVRAGLKSKADLLFSSSIIKEYANRRIKSSDSLAKILQEKRNNSAIQAISTGAEGFEKNFNMYIISDMDMASINSALERRLYDENDKKLILSELNALSIMVLDEEDKRANLLTSNIRGVSSTAFRKLESRNKESGTDLTEILKAIFSSKPIL